MIQNHWARLPAPARALLTAAALLLGAVALTFAMHNQDTYRTGTWDETSQSLVFGRILQIQNHQSAPGGFLGNYLVEGRDPQQDRYLFRENAPVRPEEYQPYTHQSGLQGLAFGWLNKVYSLINQGGEARERMLYATNAILLYLASLCLAAAAGRVFGPTAGLGFAAAVLCAPWVQRGMKNLYWCLWTWWLPALAGLLVWQLARRRGRVPGWGYGLVFGAVGLRCLCGFEFISDFLILCEAALFAAWVDALVRRAPARPWFFRMVYTGFAAVGGFAAALGVWFAQNVAYFGDAGEAWRSILEAATRCCSWARWPCRRWPSSPWGRRGWPSWRWGRNSACVRRAACRRWRRSGAWACWRPSAGWCWPRCTARSTPIWCRSSGTSPWPRPP